MITLMRNVWIENDRKYLKLIEECLDGLVPITIERGHRVSDGEFCKISTGVNVFTIAVNNQSYIITCNTRGLIATTDTDDYINHHMRLDTLETRIDVLLRLQEL